MRNDLFEMVCKTAKETLNLSHINRITLDTKLKDDLGLDSMSTLSFLMSLEENTDDFVVDPDTLDTAHLETVGTLLQYMSNEIDKRN